MKGYLIGTGYKGYVDSENKYQEFPTEDEYREYYEESVDTETN